MCVSHQGTVVPVSVSEGVKNNAKVVQFDLNYRPAAKYLSCKLTMVVHHHQFIIVFFL